MAINITHTVLRSDLPYHQKLVMIALSYYLDCNNRCIFYWIDLAKLASLTTFVLCDTLNELQSKKLIKGLPEKKHPEGKIEIEWKMEFEDDA